MPHLILFVLFCIIGLVLVTCAL